MFPLSEPPECRSSTNVAVRTYEETQYTTSTITVTKCPGGECGGEVTVTGPPQTIGTTTEVDVTYTTVSGPIKYKPTDVNPLFPILTYSA